MLLLLAPIIYLIKKLTLPLVIIVILSHSSLIETVISGQTVAHNNQSRLEAFNDIGETIVLPLLDTQVRFKISGLIARATVTQFFQNQSTENLEAKYIFPLPEDSAVDHMKMTIGQKVIVAEIKEKQQAEAIYQAANQQGVKTSLLSQNKANVFTTKIANIKAGEIVEISIEYQQLVQYDNGEFSVRFPTAIASLSVEHKEQQSISIDIDLDAGIPLQYIDSPYHQIVVQKQQLNNYFVMLKDYEVSEKDFQLRWRTEGLSEPTVAAFTDTSIKNGNNVQHTLLMILPPDAQYFESLDRDITFVIDVSGSMQGPSIKQAIEALYLALSNLSANDRFNVITFNNKMKSLFNNPVYANEDNISRAKQFISKLEAEGGTEMLEALKTSLMEETMESHVRQIVFLTDGDISNEKELFLVIKNNLAKARLFTVGIGSAPNSYFMRKAAEYGRGSYTYIGKIDEVSDKMSMLFKKLQSPVMRNINFHFDIEVEHFPTLMPDLYFGEPLILTIKSNEQLSNVYMSGERGTDFWQDRINISKKLSDNEKRSGNIKQKGLAVSWARAKIESLLDEQITSPNDDTLREQIINLSLEHHIVSPYTSLIAVDKQRAFAYPQTALGWQLQFLLGVLLILISICYFIFGLPKTVQSGLQINKPTSDKLQ